MLKRLLWFFAWVGAVLAEPVGLEPQRALFLQAEQALEQGRIDEARHLRDSLEGYPLQVYLGFRLLDHRPGAEAEIPAFLAHHGQTRYAAPLRRQWLEFLARKEAWDDYVRAYQASDDPQAQCDYYWALHRLGRAAEAYAGAAKLWDSAESRPTNCDRLFAVWQASPAFTPEQVWKRLGLALDKHRLPLAHALRDLLPAQEDRATADFWLAVHDNPRLVEQCAGWKPADPRQGRIFAHGIDRLAGDEPLRALGVWNLRRGEFRIEPGEQARIDRRLAIALATQRYPQAATYLGTLPDGVADAQTRAWRIRAALLRQDWPGVLLGLEQLDASERSQNLWRYWRARALEALGDNTAALEVYKALAGERDFHGFAAADRVGAKYPLSFEPTPVAEAEVQRLAATPAFRAIQEFRALNRPGEAQKEWLYALDALSKQDRLIAAKLAQQWGWDRLAITALAKSENQGDLSLRFPLAYGEAIAQEARERNLEPALVYGLVRRESAFDPGAKSSAGALGLMQIMPGTGQDVARSLNEAWTSERILLEPRVNLRYGSAYFRGLLDRFGNRFALATAAYNAGPNRVERWLPASGPLPADIWIETIPYSETRQYVSAVLAYVAIYRERLGGNAGRISGLLTEILPGKQGVAKPDRPLGVAVCP
ncbi:soluble lytic murein transglycosylase [Methylomagnum ishizawai]|uniref:Soluble lytic murein transglycosylase n=1 Tax=Methylomagnum ishizawai TaxID=1760988 RepID=A0A1Y6CTZ8_9GAMM|nr:lytic transglycosylase domain-containing protein [Methylomagnum ishizawai]SMF93767.1 soluble lytic murein transglycosylase [Methylomagnum ishizawai]